VAGVSLACGIVTVDMIGVVMVFLGYAMTNGPERARIAARKSDRVKGASCRIFLPFIR
jgi:hypothetical protein